LGEAFRSLAVLAVATADVGSLTTPCGGKREASPYSEALFALKAMAAANSAPPAIFFSNSDGSIFAGTVPGAGPVDGPDIVLMTVPALSGGNLDGGMDLGR
jgi:hypothetical protein